MAHTSTPWTACDEPLWGKAEESVMIYQDLGDEYEDICEVLGQSDVETRNANVRLIIAAPELLEVLIASMPYMVGPNEITRRAKEVIALAKGST